MKDDEGAAHAELLIEYRALEEKYAGQDQFPEEIDTHLGKLKQAMEKFEIRPLIFEQAEIARAGAFVTLDRYGELAFYRGYVRPEDEPHEGTAVQDGINPAAAGQGDDLAASDGNGGDAHGNVGTIITSGGQPFGVGLADDEGDGMLQALPERLVTEVTAHRTLALRVGGALPMPR